MRRCSSSANSGIAEQITTFNLWHMIHLILLWGVLCSPILLATAHSGGECGQVIKTSNLFHPQPWGPFCHSFFRTARGRPRSGRILPRGCVQQHWSSSSCSNTIPLPALNANTLLTGSNSSSSISARSLPKPMTGTKWARAAVSRCLLHHPWVDPGHKALYRDPFRGTGASMDLQSPGGLP